MSHVIFAAADSPLESRPNPHEKMLSVNEAIALGVKNIPSSLLESDFDRDKPNVIMVCDRDIKIDIETGCIDDGDFDDDFAVWVPDLPHDMPTEKPFAAVLQWGRFTEGRTLQFIEYLREQLKISPEIELFSVWLDDDVVIEESAELSINELTPSHIQKLEQHPIINTRYKITR